MQEKKSNNLISVAVKTLVFLFVLTILLTTIFLVAFPKASSNILTKMGADGLASKYAKVTYERTKDFNDLAITFNKSVLAENYEQVKKYGKILVDDQNFDDYVKFQNANVPAFDYRKWVYGNIAVARLNIDGLVSALDNVKTEELADYLDGHSMSYIINELVSKDIKLGNEEIKLVNEKFDVIYKNQEKNGGDCLAVILDAYNFAKRFCGDDVIAVWQDRYEKVL